MSFLNNYVYFNIYVIVSRKSKLMQYSATEVITKCKINHLKYFRNNRNMKVYCIKLWRNISPIVSKRIK